MVTTLGRAADSSGPGVATWGRTPGAGTVPVHVPQPNPNTCSIRGLDLRKPPSVSESLDWARSLVILNAQQLDPALVESTLTMLVKYEKDLDRVKGAIDKVLAV